MSPTVRSHLAAATLGLIISALVINYAKGHKETEPRHHIYWCHLAVHETWNGFRLTHTMSLPCMYRTNDPRDV